MAIDLTSVKGLVNDVKRRLYYEEDLTVKFLNVSEVILEITENWYLDKNPERKLDEAEFHLLKIADVDLNLSKVIPYTTSVLVGKDEYEVGEYNRSKSATKEWLVRLQTSQMKRDF